MRRSFQGLALVCASTCVLGTVSGFAPSGGSVLATEAAKLVASSPADFDRFSESVAISGDTAVVGMSGADIVGSGSGAAVVFVRTGGVWAQQALLTSLDLAAGDSFGRSVAIEGDQVVVGAIADNDTASLSGSAYVFERSGTSWSQSAKLVASDAAMNAFFGLAVDLSGDTVAISASGADGGVGAAYVFVGGGASWVEEAKLSASDGMQSDGFGIEAELDGDVLVVGAAEESSLTGAAYVFERTGSSWSETAKLVASDAAIFNRFGDSVAVAGDTIAVGSPGYVHGAGNTQGAAYVFERSGTTWVEEVRLEASDGDFNDRLGEGIALDADLLLVGASQDTHAGVASAGSAYVFLRQNGAWIEEAKLVPADYALLDLFGLTLSVSGAHAVVGAINADEGAVDNGAAYLFELVIAPGFCDAADGSLAACPCGNAGSPDTGCDLQQGTGGVSLTVAAQETAVLNRATFVGAGYPATGTPGTLVIRSPGLDPATPTVFGDGLRCVGTPVVRLAATSASGGASTHTFGHGAMVGGGTFYYQLWFRNTPAMFCAPDAFNLSNGRALTW